MTDELKQEMTEKFNSAYGDEVKIGLREALRKVYIDGCEHGYQYAIKKTIEFLKEKEFGDWIEQEATSFVEDFRKAMEK